jgi:2-polyprenyl-3-methyl-5-hydroxy-6-metoxy-1,4-benzoquinol methylase
MKFWPLEDLERVSACPACGGSGAVCLSNLTDIVFKCADGEWSMKQCQSCSSGYLDPRPTPNSIHRAYAVYYTHGDNENTRESKLLPKTGWFHSAINGRLNLLYGLKRQPASAVLGKLLTFVPFIGSFFDPLGRSLHRPPFAGASLLDFGCGDGRFLHFAKEMGWSVVGVDFDEKAVLAARAIGLDVRLGGFESIRPEERFDAITMSHVIEHVHDPIYTLRRCFDLLKPDGILNVETPNFEALGRHRFGEFWRGMEVPRHLVIFTEDSLKNALQRCGFSHITCISRNFVTLGLHAESRKLLEGKTVQSRSLAEILNPAAIFDGFRAIVNSSNREFVKFTAQKAKELPF